MIVSRRHQGRTVYDLVSRAGKILGTHSTHHQAEAQEAAINISKARAAGHRIPRTRKGKRT